MTYPVVVDCEFLLEWCECFDQPQVWYISYVATTGSCGTLVVQHSLSL